MFFSVSIRYNKCEGVSFVTQHTLVTNSGKKITSVIKWVTKWHVKMINMRNIIKTKKQIKRAVSFLAKLLA